jgi:DNA phosphorothioation-associated DGQHR protein 1
MSKRHIPFVSVPALEVTQPFGVFYVAKLQASTLLDVTFADPLRVTGDITAENVYQLKGAQRTQQLKRLRAIADFIETTEAAFPNSIILGANYNEDGELEENEEVRWKIDLRTGDDCLRLIIPTNQKLASIIDGQHRLNGFVQAREDRLAMELLCAVYLDIPYPYQAYIFATINFNQKKVDRSLAYELFGISLDDEPAESWSPDKTAVFLCRKLNMDVESPLHQHIIIAAQNEEVLFRNKPRGVQWAVSTATVVDGILKLFSSNPQKDRDLMHRDPVDERSRSVLKDDRTPLRNLYLSTNDLAIYTIVNNYFLAARQELWSRASGRSYIIKTVGIQALFDILSLLMKKFKQDQSGRSVNIERELSVGFFSDRLGTAAGIDFSDSFFQASGGGRTRIKNTLALKMGLVTINDVPQRDRQDYSRLTRHTR